MYNSYFFDEIVTRNENEKWVQYVPKALANLPQLVINLCQAISHGKIKTLSIEGIVKNLVEFL